MQLWISLSLVWLVAMPRRAEEYILLPRSSVQAILRSLAEATSVLEKAAPFVPDSRARAPEDTRKGRSKGKPRDASRSRDRRGQSKGGTSGSSLGLPRKGNNKGRGKDKDAPPSKTPCFYKSRFEGEECERWALSQREKGKRGKAYGIPSPIPLSLDPDLCVRRTLDGSTLWRLTYGNCQGGNQITSTVCGSVSIRNIM